MNEWEMLETGADGMTAWGLDDLLNGAYTDDIIDAISRLKGMFGENFEKLHEWHKEYNGKAYFKKVRKGNCRCGSCDDIYKWCLYVNR